MFVVLTVDNVLFASYCIYIEVTRVVGIGCWSPFGYVYLSLIPVLFFLFVRLLFLRHGEDRKEQCGRIWKKALQ